MNKIFIQILSFRFTSFFGNKKYIKKALLVIVWLVILMLLRK